MALASVHETLVERSGGLAPCGRGRVPVERPGKANSEGAASFPVEISGYLEKPGPCYVHQGQQWMWSESSLSLWDILCVDGRSGEAEMSKPLGARRVSPRCQTWSFVH